LEARGFIYLYTHTYTYSLIYVCVNLGPMIRLHGLVSSWVNFVPVNPRRRVSEGGRGHGESF